ncbi:hypothetical protein HII36_14965 [Nonomuraea sp. NN258]|uniref:hypothetical protein n=1 Tax=Nonomuraea antri TaxID=2730852 RepID=UPI0015692ED6|nr:hypothetical protein [Nonomuraea antri]NRQ33134.1 hypothetical protein [Nonomuraea antri]
MLGNHLRRDLQWLRRQARKDRWIAVTLLAGVLAAWIRQFAAGAGEAGSGLLAVLSSGLVVLSGLAWLVSAYFIVRSLRSRPEPAESLRWVSRITRAKEWAYCSLSAYVAWHLLQFVTALFAG